MSAPTYKPPLDELVANVVLGFDDDAREAYEERAAIMEHEGCLARGHAECLALLDLLLRRPALLTSLTVLVMEIDGATQWVLTSDAGFARRQLTDTGATVLEEVDPAEAVRRQYGDLAMLTTFG